MRYKGQLSADFYVALVIFLGFIAYITFQLFQTMPASTASIKEESIRIDAYQLSELLINDGGHPSDWEDLALSEIKRIGLSDVDADVTNQLSQEKLTRFKLLCPDFNNIKNLLDVDDGIVFTIIEHRPTGDVTDVCGSSASVEKKIVFRVTRTVFITGTNYPTEIVVEGS